MDSRTLNGRIPNRERQSWGIRIRCVCVCMSCACMRACPYDRFWHVAQRIKPNDFIYNQSITLYSLQNDRMHSRMKRVRTNSNNWFHFVRALLLPWLTLPYDGSWKRRKKKNKSVCWMNCEDSSQKIIHSHCLGRLLSGSRLRIYNLISWTNSRLRSLDRSTENRKQFDCFSFLRFSINQNWITGIILHRQLFSRFFILLFFFYTFTHSYPHTHTHTRALISLVHGATALNHL